MSQFVVWDGQYEKMFYDVRTQEGEIVRCWPNNGFMCSMDGSGRNWGPADCIEVMEVDL